jgi:hypothetical protein
MSLSPIAKILKYIPKTKSFSKRELLTHGSVFFTANKTKRICACAHKKNRCIYISIKASVAFFLILLYAVVLLTQIMQLKISIA